MVDCSLVNIQRLANYYFVKANQPFQEFEYQNVFKRVSLKAFEEGKVPVYDRKFSTDRRKNFIEKRRKKRRDEIYAKSSHSQRNAALDLKKCDCLRI